tara:strand:- start:691 stop:1260 length:570 start_codon:yes stop_codon:yes gene_type:complete
MLNFYKLIEIIVSVESLIISTMIPVYIPLQIIDKSRNGIDIPITWQITTVILLTLIFNRRVVYNAFTIYIIIGLFLYPVFDQGGSLGYLLTPNFGYLLGTYPLIKIIDKLNKKSKITIANVLFNGFIGISAMHLTGIFYNFIQITYYQNLNIFFYNLGKYTLGKIGYHLIMLVPIIFLIKPINYFKLNK